MLQYASFPVLIYPVSAVTELTNCVDQHPIYKKPVVPQLLKKFPEFHDRVHDSPPFVLVLSQSNTVQALRTYCLKIQLKICVQFEIHSGIMLTAGTKVNT
jgi:hypothetical protein